MIKVWLYCCAVMVVLMIFIGGLTRLSGAGLSIVEWKPVTGIIPPLSETQWAKEFTLYQKSPEYKTINSSMNLKEFKYIYLLEFAHRFAARLTGFIICIPLLYFYLIGTLSFKNDKSYIILPILLLIQAVMGWYMVKSGLINNPHVSHFRLGTHLILAVILYHLIIQKIFFQLCLSHNLKWGGYLTLILIYLQIFLGALVAGLDAGLIYNTFPLMGNHVVPVEFFSAPHVFNDPVSVQFMHRFLAYLIATICLIISYRKRSIILLFAMIFQITAGIITLLYNVPLWAALMHQLGAVILLSSILYTFSYPNNINQ